MSNSLLLAQPVTAKVVVESNLASNTAYCEAVKPYTHATNLFFKSSCFQFALEQLTSKMEEDPVHEFIVSFGRDSLGQAMVTPVAKGNRSTAVVPAVLNGFADLHNHPKNTPPSSGDLYGLLMKNRRNNQYTTRYILAGMNTLYALVVTDSTAAYSFLKKYPPQQTPGFSPLFPDELLNEFREMKQRFGASEESAMAYMLEKYSAGVVLMKQDGKGEFAVLRTEASGAGDAIIFLNNYCR